MLTVRPGGIGVMLGVGIGSAVDEAVLSQVPKAD